jgi:hypothetical protein
MITLTPEQQQDIVRRFQGLATQWKATTRYRSNTHSLRNHPVYQELVALGEPIVPLILAELERESNVSWFTLLTTITGEDPVSPAQAGRVDDMVRAWLDLGATTGYRPSPSTHADHLAHPAVGSMSSLSRAGKAAQASW